MKKFIITLCGVLVAGTAMGVSYDPKTPTKTTVTPWWNVGTNYSKAITSFYTEIGKEMFDERPSAIERHGTWNDEGAIIIWAAREIYAHGAKLCPVQIQGANHKSGHVWIDYYWNLYDDGKWAQVSYEDEWNKCLVVCTAGYSGSDCGTITGNNCFVNNFENFNASSLPDWQSLRSKVSQTDGSYSVVTNVETEYNYRETENMTVLDKENEKDLEMHQVILGIVSASNHEIQVAPIQVIGKRNNEGNVKSWIKSAFSNGKETILCEAGYVVSGGGCVASTNCASLGNLEFCSGYSNYNSSQHIEVSGNGCKEYECAIDGYGFTSDTNHTCISCNDKKHYVDGKVCKKCDGDKVIDSNGKCQPPAKTVSKYDMANREDANYEKCWMKKSFADFKSCFGL